MVKNPRATKRQIEVRGIDEIELRKNNPRQHSDRQIDQIAASLERFGFTNPILIDKHDVVIAGHGRLAAARRLGLWQVPTIRLEDLTDEEARAYVIADNKLAENATWDPKALKVEIEALNALEIDFPVTITGFEPPEIDFLIGSSRPAKDLADEGPAALPEGPPVSRSGDVWIVGEAEHRIHCADARSIDAYEAALKGERAAAVFTDPPYNVPINGHVKAGQTKACREFAMAVGEMTAGQFEAFLATIFDRLVANSKDGALHFICMDWRHMREILGAAEARYSELKNVCVWAKDRGGMGSLYRSRHELIFVFKSGSGPHVNNIQLGKFGRCRTNVWNFPSVCSEGKSETDHPTIKPTGMIREVILDCTNRGDVVLDCFGGSGSTLLAAEQVGRRGILIEIDPIYVDLTIRRFLNMWDQPVIHAETGLSFDMLGEVRAKEGTKDPYPVDHYEEVVGHGI